MFAFAMLIAASAMDLEIHGASNGVVLGNAVPKAGGMREEAKNQAAPVPQSSFVKKASDPIESWHDLDNFHIVAEENFCKHIAHFDNWNGAGGEQMGMGNEPCSSYTSDGGSACNAAYSRVAGANGADPTHIIGCNWNVATCGDGATHNCTWSLYMDDLMRQTSSQTTNCYADLLEAKRSLDGLLHEVNETYALLMVQNAIIEAENGTIRDALNDQQTYWEEYMEAQENCTNHTNRNLLEILQAELDELKEIANPKVRSAVDFTRDDMDKHVNYQYGSTDGRGASFVELKTDLSSDTKACAAFSSLVERHERRLAATPIGAGTYAHGNHNSTCHQKRTELQEEFTRVWTEIVLIYNQTADELNEVEPICLSQATYNYKVAVEGTGGVDERIQDAAQKIHDAQIEIAHLEPKLHDVEHAVSQMNTYVAHLATKCGEETDLSERLATLKNLIINLEQCPGRNDFTITVPDRPTPVRGTTPMPTPWEDRFPNKTGE